MTAGLVVDAPPPSAICVAADGARDRRRTARGESGTRPSRPPDDSPSDASRPICAQTAVAISKQSVQTCPLERGVKVGAE